ncbi:MAG: biliverdin-producing heme oxygenase [Pseudolysinimonas sp.]
MLAADTTLDVAALIRATSADDHRATESRAFITRLMGGELSLADYTRYLAQFGWVYDALESRADNGPDVFDPRLRRLARIESDLAALGASDWRERFPALPATAAYARHLHTLVDSDDDIDRTVRYLAHHYARYLGDLSGGQAIATLVARHYGATPEQLSFYDFSDLGSVVHAKREYRERMNALPLDAAAVEALTAEVRVAFAHNGAIFDELDA